tara:strand:- start:231 stop:485 length:255 start_codon:yes stop_codon:yes gene_type:complete
MENVDEMDEGLLDVDLDDGTSVSPAAENPSINWTPILIALAFLIVFTLIIVNPMGIQFHKLMYGNSFGISEFSYRPPAAALMSA